MSSGVRAGRAQGADSRAPGCTLPGQVRAAGQAGLSQLTEAPPRPPRVPGDPWQAWLPCPAPVLLPRQVLWIRAGGPRARRKPVLQLPQTDRPTLLQVFGVRRPEAAVASGKAGREPLPSAKRSD